MLPKLPNPIAWQQAEQLMQPALIRVIDNIRKQLEDSPWQGRYENRLDWPPTTTEAEQEQVLRLQAALETATTEAEAIALQQQLSALPQPMPMYQLWLSHEQAPDQQFDLWEFCYQICFLNYPPATDQEADAAIVAIDTSLFEADTGDVDWLAIDIKTKALIGAIFQGLPSLPPP